VIAKLLPWRAMPIEPLIPMLPLLKWRAENGLPASRNAAALILYVTLVFVAERKLHGTTLLGYRSGPTYTELERLTGLSRALISAGLKRLLELELIEARGSRQDRTYLIDMEGKRWFKLPSVTLFDGGRITPFQQLTLRSKLDLHALKLYVYLASVRDNSRMFSMSAHETIHEKTGIPEGDIRRAHSLLISVGLLAAIEREYKGVTEKKNEPNKYYLRGHEWFVRSSPIAA
jgi:DNA-binding transcriptional ArsR family regulator